MGNVFGEQKTMKQIIREQKRMVDRSCRQLDREREGLKRSEAKIVQDIKGLAKAGQMKSVKIMAKDLIRIRKHQEKFLNLNAQLRAISLQMTTMASVTALTDSMKKVTKAMVMLNGQVNLPQLQKVMMEFQKQSEMMDMKQEVVGDAIEDAMDNEEDVEESEAVVAQVLDEIGISMADGMVDAPAKRVAAEAKEEKKESKEDKELEARLNNLGK